MRCLKKTFIGLAGLGLVSACGGPPEICVVDLEERQVMIMTPNENQYNMTGYHYRLVAPITSISSGKVYTGSGGTRVGIGSYGFMKNGERVEIDINRDACFETNDSEIEGLVRRAIRADVKVIPEMK